MKLTVITATYNSAATLSHCMESVLSQEYKDFEYLVIDGGSKDHTAGIVEEYRAKNPNIRWISEKDKGIYDALNKGIRLSRGEVLGFVHSDDFLAHNRILQNVVDSMQKENAHGVFGDLQYVDKGNPGRVVRHWKSNPFKPGLLQHGWMPAHPTLYLKKEVYDRVGEFNINYRVSADYDFMLRVLQTPGFSFAYLPEVITKMRVGGNSNRSLKNIIQKSREDLQAIRSNRLPLPLWVLMAKNLSKIPQFF